MGRIEKVLVPDIGDFDHVDVVEVLVATGDRIEKDASLISLESDKATMDVPSPLAGVVHDVALKKGDKIGTGSLILTLEVEEGGVEPAPTTAAPAAPPPPTVAEPVAPPAAAVATPAVPRSSPTLSEHVDEESFGRAYASPSVRRVARELGVDLGRVRGTGRKGRILREDVQGYVKRALDRPEGATGASGLPPMPVIDFTLFGEVERRPLSRIQRLSGVSLHRSWLNVPHVTQHDEADITELEAFRKAQGEEARQQGVRLTPLAFILKACVATLRAFPALNSSLDPDGEHLILKKYVHLGFAVDTEHGLLVPVIRDADRKSILDLARELADLSARGRQGKLKPDEMKGASFTVSSLGGIGGTAFTPIVNAPEVAILGVSRSQLRPLWQDGAWVPRLMLPLSLSYDHRVIDGAMAVRATTHLAHVLGDIRRLLL